MTPMYNEQIAVARHRLEVLTADTASEPQRDHRRISAVERAALIQLLQELHRLHVAVSEQREKLEAAAKHQTRAHRKPAAARRQPRTTPKPKETRK